MGASGGAAPLETAPSQCGSKTIDVCSEIIEEIKSPRLRSEAFVNRALAYLGQIPEAEKESVDKAFADFNEAVRLDAKNRTELAYERIQPSKLVRPGLARCR